MYLDNFRFSQPPFSIAPDPAFLYLSDRHREALAHLMYGLQGDGGFVLVIGDVGTGKTTLVRSVMDQVPSEVDVAFVLNPRVTVQELLETLCDELGVSYPAETKLTIKAYIDRLNAHLLTTHALGRTTVVIIDEAQNLSSEVLEQVRLLTNLETNERKLLRIILLGQTELSALLDRREMRQLAQRITARYHLGALNREESRAYIAHRLTRAGGSPHLFTRGAANESFRLSRGVPRLINVIADRALLGAYVEGKPRVTAAIVRRAAREVFGKESHHRWIAGAALSLLVVGAAWALLDRIPTAPGSDLAKQTVETTQALDSTPEAGFSSIDPGLLDPDPVDIDLVDTDLVDTDLVDTDPVDTAPVAPDRVGPVPVETNRLVGSVDRAEPDVDPVTDLTPSAFLSESSEREIDGSTSTVSNLERPTDQSIQQTQRAAYNAVLKRWGIAATVDGVPCNYAPRYGLQCLKQTGTLTDLIRLNRPVVLELWDSGSAPFYGALVEASPTTIKIRIGDTDRRISPGALEGSWFGTYIVLWRMPPDYNGNLNAGDVGYSVGWLRDQLEAYFGATLSTSRPASAQDQFGVRLQDAVIRFQRERGLRPDGIVGPATWIELNTASEDVPTLAGTS